MCLQQIAALSAVYFISIVALDTITNVGAIDDLISAARLIMLLPVAILDAVFILWVFASLSATLRTLQFRNATTKLQLYRRFTNALAVWVWLSVAWAAYETYFKVSCMPRHGSDQLCHLKCHSAAAQHLQAHVQNADCSPLEVCHCM